MLVTDLKQLLAGTQGGTFKITASQLGVDKITQLFSLYLADTALTLSNAAGDPNALAVQGNLSLGDTTIPAQAVFRADSGNINVAGIVISCTLPGWTWTSPNVAIAATSAGKYLTSPNLIFVAVDSAAPAARLTGQIPITDKDRANHSILMTAPVPVPDPNNPKGLVFSCQPNVSLSDPNALSQFVPGANFAIIPQGIPVASTLELSDVSIIVGPNIDAITSLQCVLQSNEQLTIVPDVFWIEKFTFTLIVQFPGTSTDVYGSLSARMDLNGAEIDVAVSFPELGIEGSLAKPLPLAPFLRKFINVDGVPDDFEISILMFTIDLTPPPNPPPARPPPSHPWMFEIGLSNLWEFKLWDGKTFKFEQLLVNASGAVSGQDPALFVYSAYSIAGTQLYLSAQYQDKQWAFSGGTVGYQVINFIPLIQDLGEQFNLDNERLPSSLTAFDLTNIQLGYTTGTQEFKFSCAGQLAISDVTVDASLKLDIKKSSGSVENKFEINFDGTLAITAGETKVTLQTTVDVRGGQTVLYSTLNAETTPLKLADLMKALGFNGTIPDGLDIALKGLGVVYQSQKGDDEGGTSSTFIVTAESNYGSAMFIADKKPVGGAAPSSKTTYVFGVNPTVSGSLSDIPLIGSKIPPSLNLSLDAVQVLLASDDLTKDQVASINKLLADLKKYLPGGNWQLDPGPLNYRAELSMTLSLGSDSMPFVLGVGSKSASPRLLTAGDEPPTAHYLNIQKSIGPLFLNRVGFEYVSGQVEFLLDANLTISALSISLMGLYLRTPLNKFQPTFGLQGLGLQLTNGPLSITGAFLSMTPNGLNDPDWEYGGEIMIQAESFGLAGVGAYGQFKGVTSFFIFVMLDAPLGGPAFFFVTGLAAGFGYNRNLTIPTLTDLPAFPLVAAAMAGETGSNPFQGMTNNPGAALTVMEKYLGEAPGENWAAAGVRFTSFQLLQSFALVTVSFGTRFEIALLGLSAITVPTEDPKPIAYAELAVEVTFAPDDGVLAVSAQLTPASYVLSNSCHLTGGFAFYSWFKNNPATGAIAGDFVVTLGGYFPGYNIPKLYPSVPIIGANWQVDSSLSIKGGLYFALIPSAVMAGGYLSATWQSGDLKAWFDADANFLLSWKPFHYQANMSLTIGASWTLHLGSLSHTFTIHAGVDLSLWGPPFAGRAHIDLDIISFTITFGPENPPIESIWWKDFKSSFLPPQPTSDQSALGDEPIPTKTYCLVQLAAGMRKDLTQTTNPWNLDWVIDPETFQFVTSSVIPITAATWVTGGGNPNGTPITGSYPKNFGVGPVGVANGDLSSEHTITIHKIGESAYAVDSSKCTIAQVFSALPAAPWSKAMSLDLVSNPSISAVNATPSTISGLATGFTISANVATPETTPTPIDLAVLANGHADDTPRFSWSAEPIPATDSFDQSQAMSKLMSTLADKDVSITRGEILAALVGHGVPVAPSVHVNELARGAANVLLAPPVLSYLGEERAS
jgi:hypothetical protein